MENHGINIIDMPNIQDPIRIVKESPNVATRLNYVFHSARFRINVGAENKNDALALIESIKGELDSTK